MKFAFLFLFLVSLAHTAAAKDETFFVAAADGIYRGSIDSETGKLGSMTLANAEKSPGFLALSPDGKSLYATLARTIVAFAVGRDGALTRLNEQPSAGSGACHVSVDATGSDVLVANYNDGTIACLRREADGSLGERTAFVTFTGSGPDSERQKQPHAHSIYASPDNQFVYACDLGSDRVWVFKFDAAHGTLLAAAPSAAQVPPGSGPRHLAFGREGQFVYVANEMGHSVTTFTRDPISGALSRLQTVSTLPSGTRPAGVTTAEIAIHPSGKWLYVSNRGCETISELMIMQHGRVALVQSVSSPAKFPRNFALDPTGRWMVVAGQQDTRLAVLRIDPATGHLSATDQFGMVQAATCVVFQQQL